MFLTQIICSVEAPPSTISEMPSLVTVSSMLQHDNAALGQLVDVEDSDSVTTESSEEEGRLLVDIDETSSTSSSSDSPPPPQRRPRLSVRLQAQDWETWQANNK